ncbi:hypothetical protein SSX86_007170 [Deinandra increscens subsp. villosa]|uniref:Uncharacterized protein n=1 Tax=Deinandra increscens subsp. villosa TaxID=3103831 RepID=A0AAP0DKU6_9ASTR
MFLNLYGSRAADNDVSSDSCSLKLEKDNFMESQSLPSQNETDAVVMHYYSAHDVAVAFVKQYYEILEKSPKEACNFYKNQSVRSHPCVDGSMKTVTTVKDIDDEIMASNMKKWKPDLDTMHAQDSVMESVIVGVTGSSIDCDDVRRNFAQTFLLAPQEGGGFYVHNDFLQFIEIQKISETSPSPDNVENPLSPQQANDTDSSLETAQATNKDQTEKSTPSKEDVDIKIKVSVALEGTDPLSTEPNNKSQPSVWKSAPSIQDSKKVSYASILAKEGAGPSTKQPSPNAVVKVLPKTEKHASTSPVVSNPSILPLKSSAIPNGPLDNIYDLKAIRVKDLPPKMTQESLLEVVKQFGPVKQKNIQIKEYTQDGYRYAFVEFDHPKYASSAVEARYIRFEDRVSEIHYKKLPNQGGQNYTPRPQRGGFKNENFWGREGGEGRSSGSWGNKHVDHENSGQHSGQTRDSNNRRNGYFQDRQLEKDNFMESQSLPSQNETDAVVMHYYSAHDVAVAFVKQYYEILEKSPKEACNFYKNQSVRSHPCVDGSMKTVTTVKDIDDEIMASNMKKWKPDLDTMHAQDSVMESVIVGVTGSSIDCDDVRRNFAQTFLLAPQEGGGFYVHNDFLQFIEIQKISETSPSPDNVENPLSPQQANDTDSSLETAQATNKDQTEKSTPSKEDVDIKIKVSEALEGTDPLPTEPNNKSQPSVWKSAPSIQDSKKVSYASILAKEGAGPSTKQPSPNAVVKVLPKTEKHASTSPVVSNPSILPLKSSAIPNGPLDNIYDLKAIRVKDLPPKMTQESLLEVVKQFGPVKQKNIQIKEYTQDGYRYAFVEFDHPKYASSAVEARYIRFEDRVSEIHYKKLPNQGGQNYTPRPQRGGFKNENFWGREGGEGRSSGSWGNKHVDHENSGQHSGQTRDSNNRRNGYFQDRR